jgi:hypothetical protein
VTEVPGTFFPEMERVESERNALLAGADILQMRISEKPPTSTPLADILQMRISENHRHQQRLLPIHVFFQTQAQCFPQNITWTTSQLH